MGLAKYYLLFLGLVQFPVMVRVDRFNLSTPKSDVHWFVLLPISLVTGALALIVFDRIKGRMNNVGGAAFFGMAITIAFSYTSMLSKEFGSTFGLYPELLGFILWVIWVGAGIFRPNPTQQSEG